MAYLITKIIPEAHCFSDCFRYSKIDRILLVGITFTKGGYPMNNTERRSGNDRRKGEHRHRRNDPDYDGAERRSGWDERSGKDRRKTG